MEVGPSIMTDFYWEKHLCGQLATQYVGDRGKHRWQGWQRGQGGNELTDAKGANKCHLCLCVKIYKVKWHSECGKHDGNLQQGTTETNFSENVKTATAETNTPGKKTLKLS